MLLSGIFINSIRGQQSVRAFIVFVNSSHGMRLSCKTILTKDDRSELYVSMEVDASEPMGFVLDRRMSMASPKALTGLPPGFQVAARGLDASAFMVQFI